MSSFYPGCDSTLPSATVLDNHAHTRFDIAREAGQLCGYDGNDSDLETVDDWFDEPSNDAPQNPPKMSNAMALKVCSLLFWRHYTQEYFRYHHGMGLLDQSQASLVRHRLAMMPCHPCLAPLHLTLPQGTRLTINGHRILMSSSFQGPTKSCSLLSRH